MICPHCQTNNPDTARFCSNCGRELVRKCSNCKSDLAADALYCMHCGQPVQRQSPSDDNRLSRLTAVVPGSLVRKIASESQVESAKHPGALRERRTVTTLLVDVVNSTGLSETIDLETWTGLINVAFDSVAKIVYSYEGTIARLLGDSLLAFFGAPVAHEDDPQRAVWSALEIINQIREFCQQVSDEHELEFTIRVCINTGPVIVGPVRDDLKYDFTAFGGTVNLTSRIKFAARPMSILITSNTYRFISPYFECQDLGLIDVKGMTKQVRVYEVKEARSVLGRTRGFKDLESPMVGRTEELETLLHACEAVQAGLGRAVLISGEPGLGKTRLIQEWKKAAEAKYTSSSKNRAVGQAPAGKWLIGRCVSYKQGLAYQLLIDLLRNMIGVTIGSDEPETRTALLAYLNGLFGDQAMEVYPFLGHLLTIKLEGNALQRTQITDPQALQTQYLIAMQRLLEANTKQNPVFLVLEDLHWADGSSTELFTRLLPMVSKGPILFCLVTRVEREAAGWKLVNAAREFLGGSLTEISLQNLTETDSRSLVANLLEIDTLSEGVRKLILDKAEGNPFYMEEIIRMLIDRGAIIHKDGSWVVQQEIFASDIPDNLQGLLLARIDRLPPEARYTLLVASVIGRNFPVKVLSRVIEGVKDELIQ
jgi:class 3 adenylate cyclase